MKRSVSLFLGVAYMAARLALGLLDVHEPCDEPAGVNLCVTYSEEHGCDPGGQHHHHSEHHEGCFVCNLSLSGESGLQTPAFMPDAGAVLPAAETCQPTLLFVTLTSCRGPPTDLLL